MATSEVMPATSTSAPPFCHIASDGAIEFNLHAGQDEALHAPERYIAVIAGFQSGKALDVDTLIPTPSGFVRMGDLRDGDAAFDEHGSPCRIVKAHPVLLDRPCFRIRFDDGSAVIADADHLWMTRNAAQRKNKYRRKPLNEEWVGSRPQCQATPDESVRTTAEIAATLLLHEPTLFQRVTYNHQVSLAGPLQTPDVALPLEPYTLGVWLGDGTSRNGNITCADPEIVENIRSEGLRVGKGREDKRGNKALTYTIHPEPTKGGDWKTKVWESWHHRLRMAGLIQNKHLPAVYWFASERQRLAVLQGLMDTDGSVSAEKAHCEFCNTNPRLVEAVVHLCRSLGIKPRVAFKSSVKAWRVTFTTSVPVFRLTRKLERIQASRVVKRQDTLARAIVAVDAVQSRPVRCLTVDSPSHLYLCGEGLIPTHNTVTGPLWLSEEINRRGPGDYLAVAPSYPLMQKKMLPEFLKLFETFLHLGKYKAADRIFEHRDGQTKVYFGHADDPESLESATAKAAWLDEPGQKRFRFGSWEAIQRRLAIHRGRALLTTTPYDLSWLKKEVYDRWKAGHPDYRVVNFASTMNPAFPKEEDERARRELPGWKYRMFYKGLFDRPAGMIYDQFDTDKHVCPRFPIPPHWKRYHGLDFGGVNTAGVWIAEEAEQHAGPVRPLDYPLERKTGRLYVYREYLAGGRTAAQHAEAFRTNEPGLPSAAVGGSGSEQQWRDEFAAAGYPVKAPPIKDVEVGIDRVYGAIARDELRVFSDLSGLLDELGSYSRELDDMGNPTEKIEAKESFHRLDALRYLVAHLRGIKQEVKFRC